MWGVQGHVGTNRTAQELVDGLPQRLAPYVPKRHVDGADEVGYEPPAVDRRVVPEHPLPQLLDVRRVLADEQVFYGVDAAGEHLGGSIVGGLTQTGDPFVGLDLYEEPRVGGQRGVYEGLDVGDLHFGTLSVMGWLMTIRF